jgi:carbamoyltransferase
VLNTSFNIHEEPIVCTPGDAVATFLEGDLDYLALEHVLVSRS